MQITDAINNTKVEYPKPQMKGVDKYFSFESGKNSFRIVSDYSIIGNHWVAKKPYTCYGMHRGCERCVEVEKQVMELNNRGNLDEKTYKEEYRKIPTVNIQYVCYVIDRADGDIKLAKLPYSVAKKLQSWAEMPNEYPHTKEGLPLFDVEVDKKENSGRTEYDTNIIPSTLNKDVTEEEQEMLDSLKFGPEKFVIAMKKKQMKDDGKDPDKIDWAKTTTTKGGEEIPVIKIEEPEDDEKPPVPEDDIVPF